MPVSRPIISRVVINSASANVSIGAFISEFSYTEEEGFGRSRCEFGLHPSATIIPKMGDSIEIQAKFTDTPAADNITTGTHRVNDIVYDYVKNMWSIGMNAYDYNGGALSQQGFSYTNSTLRNIVDTQRAQLGMTVDNLASISTIIAGVGQNATDGKVFSARNRADILEKAANDYGYFLRIKAGVIFMSDYLNFDVDPSSFTLLPSDITRDASAIGRRATANVISAVRVNYVQSGAVVFADLPIAGANVTNRILNLQNDGVLANADSASRYAYGASRQANKDQHTFKCTTIGHSRYVIGRICTLAGFSSLDDGRYFIKKCVHTIRKNESWRTMLELQRIFPI